MSQELLESYLGQKLDPREMYEVENHILECDFCGEALDGLESRTPTEIQIAFEKIQHSLDTRKPKPKWAPEFNGTRSPLLGIGLICLALVAVWLLSWSNRDQAKLALSKQMSGQQEKLPIDEETKAAITDAFTLDTRSVRERNQSVPESKSETAQADDQESLLSSERGGSGNSQGISRGKSGGENSGPEELETPGLVASEDIEDTEAADPTTIDPNFNQVAVGQVLDSKTKTPLSDVYFRVESNGAQVASNDQGYYNLSMNDDQAIVSILYRGVIMDKLAVDNENQLKVYLDLERKEISNIIYITNANRFK